MSLRTLSERMQIVLACPETVQTRSSYLMNRRSFLATFLVLPFLNGLRILCPADASSRAISITSSARGQLDQCETDDAFRARLMNIADHIQNDTVIRF